MNIQIFGIKKSFDSKKAEAFSKSAELNTSRRYERKRSE